MSAASLRHHYLLYGPLWEPPKGLSAPLQLWDVVWCQSCNHLPPCWVPLAKNTQELKREWPHLQPRGRCWLVEASQGSITFLAVNGLAESISPSWPMGCEKKFCQELLGTVSSFRKESYWSCWYSFAWVLLYLDGMPGRRAPILSPAQGWGLHIGVKWGQSP